MKNTLTMDDFLAMRRKVQTGFINPVMGSFIDFAIQESPLATEEYEETAIYRGHPIIQWLAKYLPFDPDVTVTRKQRRPAAFMFEGRLVAHPSIANSLRAACS